MHHVFPFHPLLEFKVLQGRQVGETAVHHVDVAPFDLSGQGRGVNDDEVFDAVEVRLAGLEVVFVPVHEVGVAGRVLFQHERAGTGVVLDDVLGEVQVDPLLQQVLRQNLHVVDRQELDEGAGREPEVELDGPVVNGPDHVIGIGGRAVARVPVCHFQRHGILTPQSRASRGVARVGVSQEAVHHVVRH